MLLLDLTFHINTEPLSATELVQSQWASLGYVEYAGQYADVEVIKHFNKKESIKIGGIDFHFFRARKHFFSIPWRTYQYIRKRRPDIIMVQGLIFPFQTLLLRLVCSCKAVIMVQHHGELPYKFLLKKWLFHICDKCTNAYLFSSHENARVWIDQGMIKDDEKVHTIVGGSTVFQLQDKQECRKQLNLATGTVFLWVGRLNDNKDPITVLKAFNIYIEANPSAKLYMAFQTGELLNDVIDLVKRHPLLPGSVKLLGKIKHDELETWYNAADYFILGSHHEACGFSLLEAMACGCIPIVTNIPSYRQITMNGKYGILFSCSSVNELAARLLTLPVNDLAERQAAIVDYFKTELSFEAFGRKLYETGKRLIPYP